MTRSVRETVTEQARSLAAGTMASLIGSPKYTDIDQWRQMFAAWCGQCEGEFESWQEAWRVFGPLHGFGDGEPAWMKRR
jgi:hypothetical protein